MTYELFPEAYAKQERSNAAIATVSMTAKYNDKASALKESVTPAYTIFDCIALGIFFGAIVGVIASLLICFAVYVLYDEMEISLFLRIMVFSCVAGIAINLIKKSRLESSNEQIKTEIDRVQNEKEAEENSIRETAEKKIAEYSGLFEAEAKRLSVKFAGSEITGEAAEWIAGDYVKTIRAADRNMRLIDISVPYTFHVYKDKITSVHGSFFFEERRCAILNGASQQAALAHALASEVKLNLNMDIETDPSGTSYTVVSESVYPSAESAQCVAVTMHYHAHNGNYRSTREWQ